MGWRRVLFTAFLAVICFGVSGEVLRPTLGKPFPILPGFAGYNGRSTEGPSWENGAFRTFVAEQAPGWVRYPGGTVANYWDWRTGTFIEGCGKRSAYPYPIPVFVAGLPAKTRIVYVANLVRRTPKDTGTKAENILAALAEFERCGHLPEAVELGNELYFKNEHAGEYAGNCGRYLADAKVIALAVKEKYPQLKLLLCMTKAGTPGRDAWNRQVQEALASDTVFRRTVHGVVQHHYINEQYGNPGTPTDPESATKAIAEGVRYPREAFADGSYSAIPEHMRLWITEYGATKRNAVGTWIAGLRSVAMTLAWLDWHERLECLLWHHITAAPDVLSRDGHTPGAVGTAFGLFMRTVDGMTSWQQVHFGDCPALPDGTPLLFGGKASDGVREKLLLLNIGQQAAYADLSALLSAEPIHIRQIASEKPYDPNAPLRTSDSGDLNRFPLAPFSLTLIETIPQP